MLESRELTKKFGSKTAVDRVSVAMQSVREVVDILETMVGAKYWPYPYYSDMLFSVR